jgi:serine protease inhibitor
VSVIFFSRIIHKATIEWDEVGTTAVFVSKGIAQRIPDVTFNRPFVFMIRQQQKTLFAGKIRQLP